ncbi:MAG: hypothetical protein O9282_06380, partial [Flavobacterium sp.]|nr:hypothetical protein [Flavobacterium sp.]
MHTIKGKLLLLVSLFYFFQGYSQNLLTNPGFEAGGNGIGFGVSTAYTQMATATQATSTPGDFGILQYPKRLNSTDFFFVGDRTSGTGKMLVVDGTTAAGTPFFWAAGNNGTGITTAVVGTTYYFSYWIRSVSDLVVDPSTQAQISVALTGGNLLTQIHGSTFAPLPTDGWKQVIYSFVATATTVQIELSNLNINATGNDFAVDDFILTDDLIVAVEVTNAQCVTPNDGAITVSAGFGGIPPYNYAISGPVNDNNTTGFFTSLPPGVYTVTVTDSALPTATVQTLNNVIVGPYLYTTMDPTICFESSTVLEVGGSSSTYTWTSAPFDSSLTTPNDDTITVSPDETTIYTVTSVVGNCAPLTKNIQVTVNAVLLVTNTTTACSDVPINLTDASITAGSSAGILSYWTNAAGTTPLANPSTVNVSGTYYIKLTQGSCVTIKPITITVQPTSTFPVNFTICPGNRGTINLTGTPFSTVTIINDLGDTYTANIGPAGTGSFLTPILQETRIYTLVSVKNFFTLCERFYTGISVTVTVIPNGCATVETIPAPGTKPLDLTLCAAGECRTLEANISDVPSTTSYVVTSIPFCPQAPFENPSWINIGPGSAFGDDDWSCPFTLPAGMQFCFYGQNYTELNVGTNQVIRFPNPATFDCGDTCPWSYDTPIPNAGFPIKNAIFGVYQDTDFAVTPPAGTQISVNYQVVGTYPCRKFIANFTNCPQFSCGNNIGLSTSQIVLYEVSNIIEVYVQRRVACTGWNDGNGTIGIINSNGTQGVAAPGRNAVPFSTDPTPNNPNNADNVSEAWRFTPTGPNVPMTVNWYEGTTLIGTGPTITVCPAVTTTYTLEAEYTICNVPQVATEDITLSVNPDLTGAPLDITECQDILNPGTAVFDLTSNNSEILGTLDPNEYDITYHLDLTNADALTNPIANPSAFVSSGQTIYAAIFLNMFGCIVVKEFDLIVDNCGVDPDTPPDLTECEDSYNTNIATFDFTPQLPLILGSNNPLDYTVTFHLSLADANIGAGDISPINSYLGTNGQEIFIRMEDSADPTRFGTTSFFLNVNPLPTVAISGTTTVCEGDTATITFTGTPNAIVEYILNGGGIVQYASLDNSGIFVFSPTFTDTTTFNLISVTNPFTNCSQFILDTATVTVRDLPTATISGSTTVCEGDTNPVITFTGADGIAPYTFTYTDPTGATQTIQTISGNSVTLPVSTATPGTFNYQLTEVLSSGTPACSQLQTGSVTVVVNALPDATITGNATVCLNDPQPQVVLTGSSAQAPYTFTYSINSVVQPTVTSTGDSFVINAPTNVQGTFVYDLISVSESSTPACSHPITGSITITVNTAPVITTPTVFVVCDDSLDNDGFNCFDLTQKDSEVSTDP